jgi:hypothetical protein
MWTSCNNHTTSLLLVKSRNLSLLLIFSSSNCSSFRHQIVFTLQIFGNSEETLYLEISSLNISPKKNFSIRYAKLALKKSNTVHCLYDVYKMARYHQDFDFRQNFAAKLIKLKPLDFFCSCDLIKNRNPECGGMHIYYTTALPTSLWHSPHICSRCTHP